MRTEEIIQLLKQTGEQVVNPRFRNLKDDEIIEKKPGDYVTVADREAEEVITEALTKAYPNALIVGEEASFFDPTLPDKLATASHAFTIDPIDGTGNYVRGNLDHAMMVAELRDAQLTRSWIWQPAHQLFYVAERSAGVLVNGKKISPKPPAEKPKGIASFRKYWDFDADGQIAPVAGTRNCAGVDYCRLVDGEIDFIVYSAGRVWDHLPGQLMLEELGGQIYLLDGSVYGPSNFATPIFSGSSDKVLREIITLWQKYGQTLND
uniref:inositol monophosphatase family protein n=1 Tax=Vaginimicrobium propionicum TaxID=1871034 RepID=UPI0013904B51|nr:inositol monophosphatase [Vaginimicrobium propionicum]